MHPRLLAKDGCSGGTCPGVYDLMDLSGQLLVRGKNADAFQGSPPGRAADESDVTISRSIVTEALRPAPELVSLADLMAELETFSYSAFRLETQQVYADTGRDEQWVALVKAGRRWGKLYQRVHVIEEPLTPSMQQELTEGYGPNVAAGEDIGIIPTGPEEWPGDILENDFWLFDSSRLLVMLYEDDGTWKGAWRITDPERVVEACRVRDAALHRATPWRTYIADHRTDLPLWLAQ